MRGGHFDLRSPSEGDTYCERLRVFSEATLISSGPWLVAVITLLVIGILARGSVSDLLIIGHFQVCVTWLFFCSLVLSGPLQLAFTRFISDRLYEERSALVVPNLIGALGLMSLIALAAAAAAWPFFKDVEFVARVFLATCLVALCCIWIVVAALSAVRRYVVIFRCFLLGYAVTLVTTLSLVDFGLSGFLAAFATGQGTTLAVALAVLARTTPGCGGVRFDFMRRRFRYVDLAIIGLLFNLGIWADQLMFWFNGATGQRVLGPLRASELYDLPFFLAYLSIVPALAVFLIRIESEFSECHRAFYDAVNGGAPLHMIEPLRDKMIDAARRSIMQIVRVQGLVFLLCILLATPVLALLGISELHRPLFLTDAAAVSMQVVLLATVNIFFYLDRRREVMAIYGLLVLSNVTLTWISQHLGASFFGFGFAAAVTLTATVALAWLTRTFATLVRDTFMLQPVGDV